MLKKWGLASILLIAVLAAIHFFVGWQTLLAPWLELSFVQVAGILTLVLLTYALRATRLYFYFSPETPRAFLMSVRLMMIHNAWNNFLPMRTGEVAFPVLMRRYFDISMERSVPGLLWFRVLDLHALLLFALIALGDLWLPLPALLVVVALWLSVPIVLYWGAGKAETQLALKDGKIASLLHKLVAGLPTNSYQLCSSWFWTLLNWAVKLLVFAWVLGFFVELPLLQALLGVIGGDLSSVLPIHGVAGFGTFEAGVMAGLFAFEIDTKAILAGAINLHLLVLGSSLIGAGLAFLIRHKES